MTFAGCALIHATDCCPIQVCRKFADNDKSVFKCLAFDLALLISATVLTVLCATHVIPLPPAGTYSFAGLAGLILIADLTAIGAIVIIRRGKQRNEAQ